MTFFNRPILRAWIENGIAQIDAYIPLPSMWPDVLISRNDLLINTENSWDIEFRTNFLTVKKREKEIFFQVDLRKEPGTIRANFFLGDTKIQFDENSSTAGVLNYSECIFENVVTAIGIGEESKILHWPNFAMRNPKAVVFDGNA
ncbi:hypothetical protein [Roseivivax isoporae]|uniref:hypothetical protein n=1 Tax=Roseivivax isoporae TaxID=591206 RepID=UPI001FCC6787|nr:hypothetical protein [Roseivivax isoporae]